LAATGLAGSELTKLTIGVPERKMIGSASTALLRSSTLNNGFSSPQFVTVDNSTPKQLCLTPKTVLPFGANSSGTAPLFAPIG
jgi:hypothetical protein